MTIRENIYTEIVWAYDEAKGTKAIRVIMKINVEGKRGREKSINKWLDTIENDMKAVGERRECRKSRRVVVQDKGGRL
jgi:hypothetical protein